MQTQTRADDAMQLLQTKLNMHDLKWDFSVNKKNTFFFFGTERLCHRAFAAGKGKQEGDWIDEWEFLMENIALVSFR